MLATFHWLQKRQTTEKLPKQFVISGLQATQLSSETLQALSGASRLAKRNSSGGISTGTPATGAAAGGTAATTGNYTCDCSLRLSSLHQGSLCQGGSTPQHLIRNRFFCRSISKQDFLVCCVFICSQFLSLLTGYGCATQALPQMAQQAPRQAPPLQVSTT